MRTQRRRLPPLRLEVDRHEQDGMIGQITADRQVRTYRDAVLAQIAASGWEAAGKPQTLKTGPNAGKRVIYVRDPDCTTIEFMEPPR